MSDKKTAICPAKQDVSDKLKIKTKRQNCARGGFFTQIRGSNKSNLQFVVLQLILQIKFLCLT